MDWGYNVTQVELIFYSKCKLIIVITVVAYIGLIIVPISAIVCPFTICINFRPMHVFNPLMYVGLRMYVGLYVCVHVCMYVCIHYVCMYVCIYVGLCMYVHVCTYVG